MPPALIDRCPRPSVMGIVNVTPDSFSDGGQFLAADAAVAHAERVLEEGAAIVDIGGESTRPGAEPVGADEELRRVVPVIAALRARGFPAPISIDTSKAAVASRAIELGAVMVNDVTGLRGDPGMAEVVAGHGVDVCVVHMQGEPRTMQVAPRYDDVVDEVRAFLEERLAALVAAGVREERVWVDPGLGFGKTVEHNLELVARLDRIATLGRPVVVGASRKRFLGRLLGDPGATSGPLPAALAIAALAVERGAWLARVHDVREHVQAMTAAARVAAATERAEGG